LLHGGCLVELCAAGTEGGVDGFIGVPIEIEVSGGLVRACEEGDIAVK
jgi:hypothetical protein